MRKIASRRLHEARRMREASIHEYRFLLSDGNGAASRGGEPDTYFERKVRAANLKNAVIKIFPDLNYGGDSFKDYLDDYYGDDPDRPEFETGEEILDWLEENTDVSGGDPWIEGYAVDGKVINHPSYLNEILEECSREEAKDYLDGVDLDFWGLEFYDDEEDEDEEDEEDEEFEEAKRTLLRRNRKFTEALDFGEGFTPVKKALDFAENLSDAYILAEGNLYAPESTGCALPDREGFIVLFGEPEDYIEFGTTIMHMSLGFKEKLAVKLGYKLGRAFMVAYADGTFIQGFVDVTKRLPEVDIGSVTFADEDEDGEVVPVSKTNLGTEVFDNWAHNDECPTWHKAAMALVKLLN